MYSFEVLLAMNEQEFPYASMILWKEGVGGEVAVVEEGGLTYLLMRVFPFSTK